MSFGSASVWPAVRIDGVAPDVTSSGALPLVTWLCSLTTSMSCRTSASITFSDDFVRSWLRSRRTVSWFASTSSLPPATKPTTSTRWNGDTSIFGWIGVSIGISYVSGPQASAKAAQQAATNASARLLVLALAGPVIDFLEQLVVLTDLSVVGIQLNRLFVGLSRVVELTLVLVGDCEVVEGRGVGRVELGRALPAINRFAPQAALRHVDAELDLRLRVASCVGERRRRSHGRCA